MVTMGVALMLGEIANRDADITGGADGLDLTMGPVLGLFPIDFTGQRNAALSLAVLFLLFVLARRLGNRHSACRSRNSGQPSARGRARHFHVAADRAIYAVAAAYAGVAGALLAETTQIASLDLFDFHRSADAC